MAFKIGDKYFTASEQGGLLQTISERDILGRLGTGGSLEASRKAGDLFDVEPSQIRFERRSEIDKYAEGGDPGYNIFGPQGHLGRISNLAQAQALGITPPSQLPQGQIEANPAFQQYLQQTGQNASPGANLSVLGGAGQYDATLSRDGRAPFQAGSQFGQRTFGRVGAQVFETTGGQRRPITEREFNEQLKAQGLNLDVLTQLSPAPTLGQQEAEKNLGAGVTGTMKLPGEQNDFLKTVKERFAKTDEMVANLLTAGERSAEEKELKKTIGQATTSFEAGLTDIYGQTIPFSLILGQGAELERRATDKIKALTRLMDIYKEDRETKYNILSKAYDLSRNSTNDMLSLYKLTQPDKLAFDSKTGVAFFQNPLTNEVYQTKVPGFVPQSEVPSSVEEFNYLQKNKLLPSGINTYTDYVQWKAKQFGTEPGGTTTTNYDKALQQGIDDLYGGAFGIEGAREKLATKLRSLFPNVDVAKDVYGRVQDGYEKSIRPKISSSDKVTRLQELLIKSDSGQNLDALTPAEQAEMYSLL